MAETVIAYSDNVVTPITNGISLPIPNNGGGVQIASLSVFIDPANPKSFNHRVELRALIGVRLVGAGNIRLLVRIWRAGTEIYYNLVTNVFDNNITLEELFVETAPLGVQNYQLIIENQTPATTAFVSGPLVFTATVTGK
ncbi:MULTISPECIES: hypothetical protein [unclassified Paenibacillus]|uniref:hypothetical protein n=1 Tax=unclassified Paenibacillus TaxID=185978 RepID=UPI0031195CF6